MRKLIVMVGLPASGKSTLARAIADTITPARAITETLMPARKDPQDCVPILSLDNFRRLMCPTHANTSGERTFVGHKNFNAYLDAYYAAVRGHMQVGSTLILDNTHVSWESIKTSIALASKYRYEVLFCCVDASAESCIVRDFARHNTEVVGGPGIRAMADLLAKLDIAACMTANFPDVPWQMMHFDSDEVLTHGLAAHVANRVYAKLCEQPYAQAKLAYKPYQTYVVVGDIHAAADRLVQLEQDLYGLKNVRVIFCGDYLDRGLPEDANRTLDALWRIAHRYDCTFIEGNHEEHLLQIMRGVEGAKKRFRQSAASYDAMDDDHRDAYVSFMEENLVPMAKFTVGNTDYIVTHGGLVTNDALIAARSTGIPLWLTTADCIYGCGGRDRIYMRAHPSDYAESAIAAADGVDGPEHRLIQVHGHRNATDKVVLSDTHYDLESKVETDEGYLSTLWINADTGDRYVCQYH